MDSVDSIENDDLGDSGVMFVGAHSLFLDCIHVQYVFNKCAGQVKY